MITPDPSGGPATSSTLVFERIRADFEWPVPAHPAGGWSFAADVPVEEVVYRLEDGVLWRQIDGGARLAMARRVSGFAVELLASENLTLSLNLEDVAPCQLEVWRP